jgi:hypothetical protein
MTADIKRRRGDWTRIRRVSAHCLAIVTLLLPLQALAGPPYNTDDPEPTDTGHYEIYFFGEGASSRDGRDGSAGIDFNYGAAPNLQLTATLPIAWNAPAGGGGATGLGNVELAVKYQFLHQREAGVDAAFFPRVFLPAGSSAVGETPCFTAAAAMAAAVRRRMDGIRRRRLRDPPRRRFAGFLHARHRTHLPGE